ncbi:MAG: hypothetical protein ACSLE1_21110 [Sphingobium sp.]
MEKPCDQPATMITTAERLEAIAQVLAVVGRMLDAEVARRRGGAGAIRRAISIALTLLVIAVGQAVRQPASAISRDIAHSVDATRKAIARPAARWAAP